MKSILRPLLIACGLTCTCCAVLKNGLLDEKLAGNAAEYAAIGRTGLASFKHSLSFGPYHTGKIVRGLEIKKGPDIRDGFQLDRDQELKIESFRFTLYSDSLDSVSVKSTRREFSQNILVDTNARISDPGLYRITVNYHGLEAAFSPSNDSCTEFDPGGIALKTCPAVEVDKGKGKIFDGVYIKEGNENIAAFTFVKHDAIWILNGKSEKQKLMVAAIFSAYLARTGPDPLENHRVKPVRLDK